MRRGRQSEIPAYQKIEGALLASMEAGELQPGDALPSERDLAKRYGVSLMTARHAVLALQNAGRVHRRPRAGTYVAPPRIQFNRLSGLTEQLSEHGVRMRSKVLTFEFCENEPHVNAQLVLPTDARVVKIQRLRIGGEEPFAIETCYVSAEAFPELRREHAEKKSLFATVAEQYGHPLNYADEEIDATTASARQAVLLGIRRDAPLLRIRQLIHASDGLPIIYGLGFYRPELHTVYVRRVR
ncbi:transcriptional regulator, GntR family [Candidatus Koribacter versatilis Ellin345]|uniref:Transcriptional regulator, GntR family n=2 Tax=Candidatus Korobacter versatilis TaxID=658062 RepID=Q1IUM3_KORVE|nr:transcriptional regulator, GntR family [Candidatus Koribacter versatilis Ellin345]